MYAFANAYKQEGSSQGQTKKTLYAFANAYKADYHSTFI